MNNLMTSIMSQVGKYKSRKRVGRGSGSDSGRTCGRGHEGQKARGSVSNSYQLKALLKIRKIRSSAGINAILYKHYEITLNNINDQNLIMQMKNALSKESAQSIFYAHYKIENTRDLCKVFNIPHDVKIVKIIGFNRNNLCIKI